MTKTLTLRSFDIPAIHKFGIGFDNLFDELMRVNAQQGNTNYPPYDIVQISDDEYMIAVAVAGFGPDNLTVTKTKNTLMIEVNTVVTLWTTKMPLQSICTKASAREVSAGNFNWLIMWKSAMRTLSWVSLAFT